jgi:prophage antirepressor-like protein
LGGLASVFFSRFGIHSLLFFERNAYSVALRKWAQDSAIPGVRGLGQDFPTVIQHLGDVVIHFLQVE